MDQRERMNDVQEALRLFVQGELNRVWAVLPGVIVAVNGNLVDVQPTTTTDDYFTGVWSKITVVKSVVMVHLGNQNVALTIPPVVNDEVLLFISSRCIDQWYTQGWDGIVKPNPSGGSQTHDMSSAFCIPSQMSMPNELPSVSVDSAQLRTQDGSKYIELTNTGDVNIVSPAIVAANGGTALALVNDNWYQWWKNNMYPFLQGLGYTGPAPPTDSETTVLKGQ